MFRPALLATFALLPSGCFLPLMTAAPQAATTVGKGKLGGTAYAEFPSVNLTAVSQASSSAPSTQELKDVIAPSLSGSAELAYGVSEQLDLEVGVDGMLYLFVLPIPTGAHAGVRYQLLDGARMRAAAAARFGVSSFNAKEENKGPGATNAILALTGTASGVVQWTAWPVFKPSLALSAYPTQVWYDASGVGKGDFFAFASAATLNLALDFGRFELTPFGGVTLFLSPKQSGARWVPQVGLALSVRPEKPRTPPEGM